MDLIFHPTPEEMYGDSFNTFVDIGVHQDGLVHISQMSDRFIKHPLEVLSLIHIAAAKIILALPSVISIRSISAMHSLKITLEV